MSALRGGYGLAWVMDSMDEMDGMDRSVVSRLCDIKRGGECSAIRPPIVRRPGGVR